MNKTVKRIVSFVLIITLSLCSVTIPTAKAQERENTSPEFKVSGASIRFVEVNDKKEVDGIRFAVAIREDIFKGLSADQKANYRLLVMPTSLVDGELEKDETYSYRNGQNTVTTRAIDISVNWNSTQSANGYKVAHVYLYSISKSYYTTELTARMYYQEGANEPIYSEQIQRSYTGVASAALGDVTASEKNGYNKPAGNNYSPYDAEQRNALLGVMYEKTGTWDYDGEDVLSTIGSEKTEQNTTIHPMILEREQSIHSSNFIIETSFKVGVSDESAFEGKADGTDGQIKGFVFGHDNATNSYMILDFRYRSNIANSNGTKVSKSGWYPYLRVNNGTNGGWSGTVVGTGAPLETGVYDFRITVDSTGGSTQVIVESKSKADNSYQTIINTNDNLKWSAARQQFVGTKVGFISTMMGQTLEFDPDIKVYNDSVQTRGKTNQRVSGKLNADGTGTIEGTFIVDHRTGGSRSKHEGIKFSGQGGNGYTFFVSSHDFSNEQNIYVGMWRNEEGAWTNSDMSCIQKGSDGTSEAASTIPVSKLATGDITLKENDEILVNYKITVRHEEGQKVFEIDYILSCREEILHKCTEWIVADSDGERYQGEDVYLYSEDDGNEDATTSAQGDGKTIYYPITVKMNTEIEKSDMDFTIEDVSVLFEEGERYTNPIPDANQPYRDGSVEAQILEKGKTEADAKKDSSMAGDPYLLRYNGKYYLYVSNNSWYCTYRCWESLDLLHYTYLGEYDLLDKNGNSIAAEDTSDNQGYDLECPWAPEVHYWNGQFYMYTSPHASGHKVLQSITGLPYGDYKVVNNDLDDGIDGSFFIDDNEDKWFVRAYEDKNGKNWVSVQEAKSMTEIKYTLQTWLDKSKNHLLTSQAGITGGQVEGPFLFKRDGIYYLVATGEDVSYPGYRLNYAYNDSGSGYTMKVGSVGNEQHWSLEADPNLILNTEGEYNSYGHGAVTVGPNLDSYWFIYHQALASNPTARKNGISRIEFSGTRMSVMGQDQNSLAPEAPDFYTSYFTVLSDVDEEGEKTGVIAREAGYRSYTNARTQAGEGLHQIGNQLLSGRLSADGKTVEVINTGTRFTAEYNFKDIPTDGTFKCLFGGGYITISGKTVQLYKGTTKLAEANMLVNGESDWDWLAYHDIIVTYKEGRITVTIDGCTKIDIEATGLGNGPIGYEGASGTQIGGAVFSNQAFGSSDNEVAKNAEGTFYASNYYEAKSGEKASVLSSESKTYKVTSTETPMKYVSQYDGSTHTYYLYQDATAFTLAEGDRAVYKIDVTESGMYSLASLFSTSSDGSVIKIQIDGETPICYTLRKNNYSSVGTDREYYESLEFQKRVIDTLYLEKGFHTITVKAVKGNYTAIEYELCRISENEPNYQNDLSAIGQGDYFKNFINLTDKTTFSEWKIVDGVHYAAADRRNMVRFGNSYYTDYKVKVDLKTAAVASGDRNAGLLLRLTQPSAAPRQTYGSGKGYYVCLGASGVSIVRIDYNERVVAHYNTSLSQDVYYTLEAECVDSTIVVRLNGKVVLKYIDPYGYTCGATALYSNETESYYKNLEITPLCGRSTSDYVTYEDTEYAVLKGAFKKTQDGVQVVSWEGLLIDNTVNKKSADSYAVNTSFTILPNRTQAIKGIVFNYNHADGSYLVMDYRYEEDAYRLYVRHYDGTAWTDQVWSCGVELKENAQYEFNICASNHTNSVIVSIEYKTGTNSFKQVSKSLPIAMSGRRVGYISTAANNMQFARLVDIPHVEIGFGWPDDWSSALDSSKEP